MKIHKKIDKILEDIIKENQKKMQIRSGGGCGGGEENLVQVLLRIQQSESLDISITNDNIKAIIGVSIPIQHKYINWKLLTSEWTGWGKSFNGLLLLGSLNSVRPMMIKSDNHRKISKF